eukprot:1992542-Pleurochrysis_carterae.AAC.1
MGSARSSNTVARLWDVEPAAMHQTKKPLTRLHPLQELPVVPECGQPMSPRHQPLAQATRQTTSFWHGRGKSCQNPQNPQTEPR